LFEINGFHRENYEKPNAFFHCEMIDSNKAIENQWLFHAFPINMFDSLHFFPMKILRFPVARLGVGLGELHPPCTALRCWARVCHGGGIWLWYEEIIGF